MKAVHVFLEADLRCQHKGLLKLARNEDVEIQALSPGDCVLFVNRAMTAVKTLTPNGVLCHAKFPHGVSFERLNVFPDSAVPGQRMLFARAVRTAIAGVIGSTVLEAA